MTMASREITECGYCGSIADLENGWVMCPQCGNYQDLGAAKTMSKYPSDQRYVVQYGHFDSSGMFESPCEWASTPQATKEAAIAAAGSMNTLVFDYNILDRETGMQEEIKTHRKAFTEWLRTDASDRYFAYGAHALFEPSPWDVFVAETGWDRPITKPEQDGLSKFWDYPADGHESGLYLADFILKTLNDIVGIKPDTETIWTVLKEVQVAEQRYTVIVGSYRNKRKAEDVRLELERDHNEFAFISVGTLQ